MAVANCLEDFRAANWRELRYVDNCMRKLTDDGRLVGHLASSRSPLNYCGVEGIGHKVSHAIRD